jgi:carboxylesterase type B
MKKGERNNSLLVLIFSIFFAGFVLAEGNSLEREENSPERESNSPEQIAEQTTEQIAESCKQEVKTNEGLIKGFEARKHTSIACAYLGVPFAKAPVGDLRWRKPEAAEARTETLLATKYGADCMQSRKLSDATIKTAATETSEDCLFLNIWKPKKEGKYPVMVWLHGGGLIIGSGAWPIYDGTKLAANNDVIVVTINYRMGSFGYLAHPDLVDSNDGFNGGSAGNYGLLDQQFALKWIKENIANFGGDPDNVTVFGESAGSWSVFTLLGSPASEGLFQKAIAQSGGGSTAHTTEKAFKIGERIAKKLDCHKAEDKAACMRSLSAEEVQNKTFGTSVKCMMTFNRDTGFCYIPRVDGKLLPKLPYETFQAGEQIQVPLIAGYTSKDPGFLKGSTIESLKAIEKTQDTWLYKFKFKKNFTNIMSSGFHGSELSVLFDTMTDFKVYHNKIALYKNKHVEKAKPLIKQMQTYWTNFAKYGNPNGEGKDSNLLEWPRHQDEYYIYLSNETKIKD